MLRDDLYNVMLKYLSCFRKEHREPPPVAQLQGWQTEEVCTGATSARTVSSGTGEDLSTDYLYDRNQQKYVHSIKA